MNKLYIDYISDTLSVAGWQIEHTVELLKEGATVPFISRYRKERTGGLDEVQVAEIKHHFSRFEELDKRKETILNSIEEQGALTDELKEQIVRCIDTNRLEDIYIPYKPKRRTKASIAREKGLEPLSESIMKMGLRDCSVEAGKYISGDMTSEEALQGARDIIAEKISEMPEIGRASCRERV